MKSEGITWLSIETFLSLHAETCAGFPSFLKAPRGGGPTPWARGLGRPRLLLTSPTQSSSSQPGGTSSPKTPCSHLRPWLNPAVSRVAEGAVATRALALASSTRRLADQRGPRPGAAVLFPGPARGQDGLRSPRPMARPRNAPGPVSRFARGLRGVGRSGRFHGATGTTRPPLGAHKRAGAWVQPGTARARVHTERSLERSGDPSARALAFPG